MLILVHIPPITDLLFPPLPNQIYKQPKGGEILINGANQKWPLQAGISACTSNIFPLTVILQQHNTDLKFTCPLSIFVVTTLPPRSPTSQNDPTEFIWGRNKSVTAITAVRLDWRQTLLLSVPTIASACNLSPPHSPTLFSGFHCSIYCNLMPMA